MATIVAPAWISPDPARLDLAAREVADAIRFARSEAMRLGEPRGFRYSIAGKNIRIFRPNTASDPWTSVYDIHHPVSKKLYRLDFDETPFAAIESSTVIRTFRGTCNVKQSVYFDAQGFPRCIDPETVPVQQYDITLNGGGVTRVVSLSPINGQVTIQ